MPAIEVLFKKVQSNLGVHPVAVITPIDSYPFHQVGEMIVLEDSRPSAVPKDITDMTMLINRILNTLIQAYWCRDEMVAEYRYAILPDSSGADWYPAAAVGFNGNPTQSDLNEARQIISSVIFSLLSEDLFSPDSEPTEVLSPEILLLITPLLDKFRTTHDAKLVGAPYQVQTGLGVTQISGRYKRIEETAPETLEPIVGFCHINGFKCSENIGYLITTDPNTKELQVVFEPGRFFEKIWQGSKQQNTWKYKAYPIRNSAKEKFKIRLESLEPADSIESSEQIDWLKQTPIAQP
ncbi:MAG: hypothetical protein OQK12_17795 [Motiliproteus sp.]|nr:hypothetical protein [Motiliproteus sp.]MCW9053531.1 hypothetical protein [Motiliproteus sp.]